MRLLGLPWGLFSNRTWISSPWRHPAEILTRCSKHLSWLLSASSQLCQRSWEYHCQMVTHVWVHTDWHFEEEETGAISKQFQCCYPWFDEKSWKQGKEYMFQMRHKLWFSSVHWAKVRSNVVEAIKNKTTRRDSFWIWFRAMLRIVQAESRHLTLTKWKTSRRPWKISSFIIFILFPWQERPSATLNPSTEASSLAIFPPGKT